MSDNEIVNRYIDLSIAEEQYGMPATTRAIALLIRDYPHIWSAIDQSERDVQAEITGGIR